jgi:hypothetical protein
MRYGDRYVHAAAAHGAVAIGESQNSSWSRSSRWGWLAMTNMLASRLERRTARAVSSTPMATATHGMWGAFWIAYGILHLLGATGALTLPTDVFPELG